MWVLGHLWKALKPAVAANCSRLSPEPKLASIRATACWMRRSCVARLGQSRVTLRRHGQQQRRGQVLKIRSRAVLR
jgi:hypothetical protein